MAQAGDAWVLAVADGAGSARLGGVGAAIAVDAAVEALTASAGSLWWGSPAASVGWARVALEEAARDRGVALGDLATTLHVAVLCHDRLWTAQIGDGAVVARRHGEPVIVDPVARGEYVNETVFVTSAAWADEARIGDHDGSGVDALALLTDGLQLLAFDMAAGTPHAGFFTPIFEWAAAVEETEAVRELSAFLTSTRVQDRTDDDTTLVLAVRR